MSFARILLGLVVPLLVWPSTGNAQLTKRPLTQADGDGKGDFEMRPPAEGFGAAVAISGRLAFVAESHSGLEPGTVTVFHRDSTTEIWSREATLTAPGGAIGTGFGKLIDADSHKVIIGAPDDFGHQGAAYIYARQSPGLWTNEGMLQSNVPTAGLWYANTSLSISGDRAIVGEALAGGVNNGIAHIYKFDSGSWVADTSLPTVIVRDRHGFGAAISGNRAVVGAYRWNPNPQTLQVGIVYVYDYNNGVWTRTHSLNIPDSLANDNFGYSVDVDGDRIVVGNFSTNGVRSSGYRIFDYETGSSSWVLRDSVADQGYLALDLDSATVISGLGSLNQVTVTSGTSANSSWSLDDTLVGTGVSGGDNFGYGVGISGDHAIIGAPGSFVGINNTYMFERQADSTWLQVAAFAGTGTPLSITGATVPCSGGMAGIFECKDIDLQAYLDRASLLVTGNMADIWGWTDPVTGHEYALITHGGGTTFVDITDPVNPVVIGLLPIHAGVSNSSWRDVKTYGDFAFVVADNAGPQGMQVFDLKELRLAQGLPGAASKTGKAATLPVTFSESYHYDKFTSAHNIAINDSSGTAFVVGGSLCGGGIHMVDISDPMAPDSTGCYADTTTGRSGTGYTHDIQCVQYSGPDSSYSGREVCFGSNETAILITDVTDNSNPVSIGKGEYPDYGYVHQGWLTDDHRYFIQDDELDERNGLVSQTRTLFWDVSDLADPVLVYEYIGPTGAIDHNQYVLGGYLYQAQYTAGLRIVDISGITEAPATSEAASKASIVAPVEVAFFDTQPGQDLTNFSGVWSVYPYFASGNVIISSIGEGLFVLRPKIAGVTIDIKVFLEGPYVPGADSMAVSPAFKSSVPTGNPYATVPFNGSALEHDIADSVATLPAETVDWVLVELRTDTESTSKVLTRAAILRMDGSIVDPNGNPLAFPGVAHGNHYVIVRHRNHLGVMSSAAVDLSSGSGAWDFTTSSAQAFGTNPMKDLGDGKWGMYGGEADLNGINTVGDFNVWLVDTKAVATGYLLPDFDLDGQVLTNDFNMWLVNTKSVAVAGIPE